jgi:Co/Zn/Cd efflux system component
MEPTGEIRFRVVGMDCSDDAAEIESALQNAGIPDSQVSAATHVLRLPAALPPELHELAKRVAEGLGYRLEDESTVSRAVSGTYRRALVLVVLLNVGFGAVEMAGGFLAGSQALKADSLDFLGDGLITLVGLLALGRSTTWRARSALAQGLFLGALGFGVLVLTIYRALTAQPPEVEVMGALGFVALVVNIAAALLLLPHRTGDASAKAVWLFSRNDAIGNAAVLIAAALVLWTGKAWPDLVTAAAIAGLFLMSSWTIVKDGLNELRHPHEHDFAGT